MGVSRVPLWLRSAARRPATAAVLTLVAALTLVTALTGPLLVRAVQQAGLQAALGQAGPSADLRLTAPSDGVEQRPALIETMTGIADAARTTRVFAAPSVRLLSADAVRWQSAGGAAVGSTVL